MGFEASGLVAGLGSGVTNLKVGDRITSIVSGGGYADYATADANMAIPIPDGITFAEANAITIQGLSACPSVDRSRAEFILYRGRQLSGGDGRNQLVEEGFTDETETYNVGKLVAMFDTKTRKLLWRGSSTHYMDVRMQPEEATRNQRSTSLVDVMRTHVQPVSLHTR
jgi:hypothetical protein